MHDYQYFIQNNSDMMSTNQIVIFALFVGVMFAGQSVDVTFSIMKTPMCGTVANPGYAIAYNTSSGNSSNFCVTNNSSEFNTSNSWTGKLFNCTNDYSGKACSSNVCQSVYSASICTSQLLNCPLNQVNSGTGVCGKCVNKDCPTGLCANSSFESSGQYTTVQSCYPYSQCFYTNLTFTLQTCLSGVLGPYCACLTNYQFQGVNDNQGICTSGTYLNQKFINDFINWNPVQLAKFTLLFVIGLFWSVSSL